MITFVSAKAHYSISEDDKGLIDRFSQENPH